MLNFRCLFIRHLSGDINSLLASHISLEFREELKLKIGIFKSFVQSGIKVLGLDEIS